MIQYRPRRTGLTDAEVLELAIASAKKQIEDESSSLEKYLLAKQQELSRIQSLTDAELATITAEREAHIKNLNNQIDELTQLLDEQLIEIDQREEQSRQQLKAEIDEYKAAAEAELLVKQQQLQSIASEDEQWLAAETEKLTQQLEADKAAFLEKHQAECDRLLDEIDLLKSELSAAYQLLDKYEEPEMPRGFDVEKVVAYKLQQFWRAKGIITHLINAYPDEAGRRVLVRLRPKTGGQSQFKKQWLNEIQVQEDLPEPVAIRTVAGAIEFEIKPRTWTAFKPWDDSPTPSPGNGHQPPSINFENPSPVTEEELENFQQPVFRFEPRGAIGRLEQLWIISLWQSGVKTQGIILSTVYRSSTGNPVS
ncbi:MAG TPA: hypothetical protein DCP31_09925, partial [Cyanobacteria bacterium UBA8543]|nr:hypothetical protein [Cyanobacteria bacterium UBA8543]